MERIVIPYGSVKLKDLYGDKSLAEKEKLVVSAVDEAIKERMGD